MAPLAHFPQGMIMIHDDPYNVRAPSDVNVGLDSPQ